MSKGKDSRSRLEQTRFIPFEVSSPHAICHPPTYLNKVLVGGAKLQLWNTRNGKLIYEFKNLSGLRDGVGISCIEASPAIDVVAVRNVRRACSAAQRVWIGQLLCFSMGKGSPVQSCSFRTDRELSASADDHIPMMATGDVTGRIAVWDLNHKRLHCMLPSAHGGAVIALAFLPGQPLLLSSGSDNSLKLCLEDGCAEPRLLRSRQGHTQPPANIRFKGTDLGASFGGERGDDHLQIVSCGNDRSLRCFHAVRERTSWEVSQKTSEFSRHQLPVMKGFSLSSANNGCKHDFVSLRTLLYCLSLEREDEAHWGHRHSPT